MARQCAYCGNPEDMTREHIFPGSVIARYEDSLVSLNDRSDAYFSSDLVVRDVCAACNNGFLSRLDNYFVAIFDKYMSKPVSPGNQAMLNFDYHTLLRFLLKVSYNSSRASADGIEETEALRRCVPYIRGEEPSSQDVMLRLQIFTSAKVANSVTREVEGIAEAYMLRSGKVDYDGPQSKNFRVRLVAFNSFWFYLIVPLSKVGRLKKESVLKGFKRWAIQPGIPVSPADTKLVIPVNKTTYIHPSVLNGMYRKSPESRGA